MKSISAASAHLSINYIGMQKWDEAKTYLEKALDIEQKSVSEKNYLGIIDLYDMLGNIYLNGPNNVIKAIEIYTKILEIAKKFDDKNNQLQALGSLAICFERQNKLESALEYYKKALIVSEDLKENKYFDVLQKKITDLEKSLPVASPAK